MGAYLDILMVITVMGLLMAGYPVAFTLAGTAALYFGLGLLFHQAGDPSLPDTFYPDMIFTYPNRVFGQVATNEVLIAVPLFVFMGVLLERSRVAEDLLSTIAAAFGRWPGGLAFAVTAVGALLAASTGIVGATVVTMSLLALPIMMRRGYDHGLSAGSITAAGTLGQIIPPSIVLILLGDQMANAASEAKNALGAFSVGTVSVGHLFAGALIPGLGLVALYLLYQAFVAFTQPAKAPPVRLDEDLSLSRVLTVLIAPLALIFIVLGSIFSGYATPTKGAAIGAAGALALAALRARREAPGGAGGRDLLTALLWSGVASAAGVVILSSWLDLRIGREDPGAGVAFGQGAAALMVLVLFTALLAGSLRLWRTGVLGGAMTATSRTTAMVFLILIGATLFSLVFRGLGGDDRIQALLEAAPGGLWGALALVMLVMFILGFFLDFIEITFVVVPLVAPPLLAAGADPVWLGVLFALNLQTSFLTPPFGFALFYLRGSAPPELSTASIYRGAVPFILIQLVMIGAVAAMPTLATWLPAALYP